MGSSTLLGMTNFPDYRDNKLLRAKPTDEFSAVKGFVDCLENAAGKRKSAEGNFGASRGRRLAFVKYYQQLVRTIR